MSHTASVKSEEFSALEERLHSISHGVGALLSVVGAVVLLVMASIAAQVDPWKLTSLGLYGMTLVLLYTASTLYHGIPHRLWKQRFQLLDHCAIYLLIAGTYTPFLLVNMRGPTGWALFAAVWSLALIGITCKLLWPQRLSIFRVVIYLLMGWMILLASEEMAAKLSVTGIALLAAGGITYTVGVIFYAVRAIPYNHAIWHLFVVGGSICHYFAVVATVLPHTV
ncbi:COG1272: Predicted membrane protein hemolysin III homolog [Halomonas citrativorans]|uniref:COG1272: Predicted membrane protein hemolysin III homolog n=1 Tax=Halomonas citrativorans TaxID=2742612 RepID=A0A1R4I3X6_9GAMM|nr:hemolysin III family protein [Halomonas citrativorans]MBE0404152.1 hemolysin III family protein [Halomonas citrativorans]SJN14478.1 COG1272: Predicted membrane protein hemolysin III homolog [Halomonas citrativorans]